MSIRAIIIVGALLILSVIGFAVIHAKPKPPVPVAVAETLAPTGSPSDTQVPATPTAPVDDTQATATSVAPVDDTPMSGTIIGGPASPDAAAEASRDSTLKADAEAAAARLDAIDEEARARAQAEAVAIERARTDAALAQARALSNQNDVLRQQAEEAEYARAQAEQAAYEAQQQQPAVVIIQPRYGDPRGGHRNGWHPNPTDSRRPPSIPGIARKNVVTPNSGSQTVQPQTSTASNPMPQNGNTGKTVANRQAAMTPDDGKSDQH